MTESPAHRQGFIYPKLRSCGCHATHSVLVVGVVVSLMITSAPPASFYSTMTIETVNVSTLKRVKNKVIGNPSAKLMLAQDELFVATFVTALSSLSFLTLLS